jgi:hypothetical protein
MWRGKGVCDPQLKNVQGNGALIEHLFDQGTIGWKRAKTRGSNEKPALAAGFGWGAVRIQTAIGAVNGG